MDQGIYMDNALRQAARQVRRLGEAEHVDSFGGLRIDQNRNELTVYRRPSAAFDAALRETVVGVRLMLQDAPYSLRDLRDMQRRIEEETPQWRHAGIEITLVGVAPDARCVTIGVAHLDDAKRTALTDRYGADRVTVERSEKAVPL